MKKLLRVVAITFISLAAIVAIAVLAVHFLSRSRLEARYAVTVSPLEVRRDSAAIAAGEHLMLIRGCVDCHGERLGGATFLDAPAIGRFFGTNLTAGIGGIAPLYRSASDWAQAIRNGLAPDGRPLLFMPSQEYYHMSDSDVGNLIAYIESRPPVDSEPQTQQVGLLGRFLYLTGQLPLVAAEIIDHQAEREPAPAPGPTAEYGAYLATGCTGCHGRGLSGGKMAGMPPGSPPASNLTPHETGLGHWTREQFHTAMRLGIRPDGSAIDAAMPWSATAHMTDVEIDALWAYFASLDPKAYGVF